MFTKPNNRLRLLVAALVLAVGLAFVLRDALAQEPDQGPHLADIDMRLKVLEKTVNNLFSAIIVIPGLAALMVVVSQIRTWLTERTETQIARSREEREAKSATTVDEVMSSVNQILAFQAAQAKEGLELLEKFDPSRGISAIVGEARELRSQVKRHNLRQYWMRITRLSDKMESLEDLYVGLRDFEKSIDCNYVRGLAGLLNSQEESSGELYLPHLLSPDEADASSHRLQDSHRPSPRLPPARQRQAYGKRIEAIHDHCLS